MIFKDKKKTIILMILAVICALEISIGHILSSERHLWQIQGMDIVIFVVTLILMYLAGDILFAFLDGRKQTKIVITHFDKRFFVVCFVIICLAYFIVFLAYYPCVWAYDPFDELIMLHGWWGKHPYGHMILMELCVKAGIILGNVYLGLALYSIIQMTLMALIFSYAVTSIKRRSNALSIVALIFFAIMPFNSILAISSVKDTLYSGFIVVILVCLMDYYQGYNKKLCALLYITASFFMLIFRKNGPHVMVLWTILLFVYAIAVSDHDKNIKIVKFNTAIIVGYFVINAVFVKICGGVPGPEAEAYAVPLQCMMGTAARHDELVPGKGNHEKLFNLIDRDIFDEDLSQYIYPHNADKAKSYFAYYYPEGEYDFDGIEAIKQFVKIGVKYPLDYLDIFLTLTKGAWYPFDMDYAEIYGAGRSNRQGYLLTDFKVGLVGIDSRPMSILPKLEYFLEGIVSDNNFSENIILRLLLSPASYWWAIQMVTGYVIYRKRTDLSVIVLFLLSIFDGVLLSPVIIVRYLYPIMIAEPVLIAGAMHSDFSGDAARVGS